MNYTQKYKQRTARGLLKPVIFILLELILFALIISIVLEFNSIPLTLFALLASLYYLGTSSIPRFIRVVKRQKAYHRLKKFDHIANKEKY